MKMLEAPTPPPAFSSYPRGDAIPFGTSEKLTRTYRGYVGIAYGYLLLVLSFFLFIFALGAFSPGGSTIIGVLLILAAIASIAGGFYLSIRSGIDIEFGLGWNKGIGIAVGILGPFCGVIALIIIQMLAIQEMKNYGIAVKPFRGLKSKDVKAKIAEMKATESAKFPLMV